jgi:hypothetical protein
MPLNRKEKGMNFNLNIHRVTGVQLLPVRETSAANGTLRSATRILEIRTEEGAFEITLFAAYTDDDDRPLLEVRT